MSEKNTDDNKKLSDIKDLTSLLKPKLGNSLEILDYSIDNLVKAGENFAGTLLKIVANIRRDKNSPIEELNLVAKTKVESGFYINWTTVISKEVFMYTDIIPLYESIELKNGVSENLTISNYFPILYGHRLTLEPKNEKADDDAVILLENLKIKGYYVLDKTAGMDLYHAKEAIKVLAKFHALGIAAKNQYHDVFDKVKKTFPNTVCFNYSDVEQIFENFVAWLKQEPRYEKYLSRFEKILSRKRGDYKCHLADHELWSTIIHFDFWTNNVMFHKDEEGKIDNLKIIDFQAYEFVDACIDLYYFMFTSLNDDVKLGYFDELLDIYYDTFIGELKSVGVNVDVYSRGKFDEILKEDAWFEILHCVMAINFFTFQPDPNMNALEIIDKLMNFHVQDLFHKKFTDLLYIYESRGWFD